MAELVIRGNWVTELAFQALECSRQLRSIKATLDSLNLDPALLSDHSINVTMRQLEDYLESTIRRYQKINQYLLESVDEYTRVESQILEQVPDVPSDIRRVGESLPIQSSNLDFFVSGMSGEKE